MNKKYIVRFHRGTECRSEIIAWALDEVRALVLAIDKSGLEGWALNGSEFRIEISYAWE